MSEGIALDSKRKMDENGWYEVKRNPLSKAGVFDYSGASIGAPDPNKIYKVYRPAEELSDPETLASFKLLPWIDDHTMLGSVESGLTPAERKGVEGVIGEDVFFEGDTLYGNIKVFSDKLANLIDRGKKELSAGYRCVYKFVGGVYNGLTYDAIQCNIRGNHLALVDKGRMGPDVAVLDHFNFTIDSREFQMSDKKEPTVQEQVKAALDEALKPINERLTALDEANKEFKTALDAKKDGKDDDMESEEEEGEDKACKDKKGMDKDEAKVTVDAAEFKKLQDQVKNIADSGKKAILSEIKGRDELAKGLSAHVGSFDHAEMTITEVAVYGVEKLKLTCDKGEELATLKGYLHGRAAPHKQPGVGTDAAANTDGKGNPVTAFLKDKS